MKKILLIEDESDIRRIYMKKLGEAGYGVDEAGDGEVGIAKATENNYDLILLDIMLPKLNGLDILKAIRDPKFEKRDVSVFLLTNLGLEKTIDEAQKLGVQNYLIKAHFTPEGVVEEVNKFFKTKEGA